VKFKSKIFLPTPLYAAQQEVDSQLPAMPHSAKWRLPTMRNSAESTDYWEFLCECATKCKNIVTCWSVTQVGLIRKKNKG
jgi:hypothetical protein